MPYWNVEYTKAVIYTVVKVGGAYAKVLQLHEVANFHFFPVYSPTVMS